MESYSKGEIRQTRAFDFLGQHNTKQIGHGFDLSPWVDEVSGRCIVPSPLNIKPKAQRGLRGVINRLKGGR